MVTLLPFFTREAEAVRVPTGIPQVVGLAWLLQAREPLAFPAESVMVMEPLYVLGELYVVPSELPVPLEGEPPGRLQLMVYPLPVPPVTPLALQVKVVRGGVVRPLVGETEHEPVTGAHTVMGCHALQLLP